MKCYKQGIVAAVILLVMMGVYQQGKLGAYSATSAPKIGVVNVTKVLENSQKHKKWQEKMQAEQTQTREQFTKMEQEIEALQANLKLRTPGSEDFLKLREEMAEKNALLEAKTDAYRARIEAQMQTWTESLYQEMLKVTEQVAKDKGLDMIIADELMDLPSPSLRDFMLTIKTKKMIYYNAKFDLTDEVLAALDKTN